MNRLATIGILVCGWMLCEVVFYLCFRFRLYTFTCVQRSPSMVPSKCIETLKRIGEFDRLHVLYNANNNVPMTAAQFLDYVVHNTGDLLGQVSNSPTLLVTYKPLAM